MIVKLFHKEKKRKETILLLCPEIFNIKKSVYPKKYNWVPRASFRRGRERIQDVTMSKSNEKRM